jgi:hypothetical protein
MKGRAGGRKAGGGSQLVTYFTVFVLTAATVWIAYQLLLRSQGVAAHHARASLKVQCQRLAEETRPEPTNTSVSCVSCVAQPPNPNAPLRVTRACLRSIRTPQTPTQTLTFRLS